MTTTTLAHTSLNLPSTLRTSGHGTPNHVSRSNTPVRVKRMVHAQPDASVLLVDAEPDDTEGCVRRSSSTTVLDAKMAAQLSIGRRRRLSITTFGDSEGPTPREAMQATIIDSVLARRQMFDAGIPQPESKEVSATTPVLDLQMPISSYAVVGPDVTVAQAVSHFSCPTVRCVVVVVPGATHVLSKQDVDHHTRDCADPFADTLGFRLAGCPPPPAVFSTASAFTAAGLLLLESAEAAEFVPVVEDGTGNFLGLVSRTDLAEALLGDRRHVYNATAAAATPTPAAAAAATAPASANDGANLPAGGAADAAAVAAVACSAALSAHPQHPHHLHLLHHHHSHPLLSPAMGPSDGSPRVACSEPTRPPHPPSHPRPSAEQPQSLPTAAPAAVAAAAVAAGAGMAWTGGSPATAATPAATAAAAAAAAVLQPDAQGIAGCGGGIGVRVPEVCYGRLLPPSREQHDQLSGQREAGHSGQTVYHHHHHQQPCQQVPQQQQQHHHQNASDGSVEHPTGSTDSLRSVSDPIRSGWDMLDNVDDALDVLGLVGKTMNAEAVGRKLLADVAGAAANVAGGSSGTGWLFKYLYDGDCAICRTFQAMIEKLDNGLGRVVFVDISSQGFNPLEHGGINYRAAMETMHILSANGQIFKGVTAVIKLLAAVDADLAANMGVMTAVLPLLSLAYMIVSKNRHQLSGVWAQVLRTTNVDRAVFGRDILAPFGMAGSSLAAPAGSPRGAR